MKIKRMLSVLCTIVMIATIIGTIFIGNLDYKQSIEIDDKLGAAMTPVVCIILLIPILSFEYEVFHTVSYFITEKQNRKTYKSVLNILATIVISCALISMILFTFIDIWDSIKLLEEIIISLIGFYFVIKFIQFVIYSINEQQ